nr:putative mitochondrial protein [Quercus suber]
MKGGGWDKKVGSRPSMANQRRVLCFEKQEAFQRSSLRCPWFQYAERSFETEHKPPISDMSDFSIFFFHFSNSGIMDLLRKGLLVDLHRPLGLREGKQHPFLDEVLHDLEDTHEIDVLLESFSGTEYMGSSVDQPIAPPVPPTNPVASPGEEAGPSNPVRPFPNHVDERIGGDSVLSIQQRLLAKNPSPSLEDYWLACYKAKDLFEIKADIIKWMIALDPEEDWMGQGARALDNPRTATGEESLESFIPYWII